MKNITDDVRRRIEKLDPLVRQIQLQLAQGNPAAARHLLTTYQQYLTDQPLPTDPRDIPLAQVLEPLIANQLAEQPPTGLDALYVADLFPHQDDEFHALKNFGPKKVERILALRQHYLSRQPNQPHHADATIQTSPPSLPTSPITP